MLDANGREVHAGGGGGLWLVAVESAAQRAGKCAKAVRYGETQTWKAIALERSKLSLKVVDP